MNFPTHLDQILSRVDAIKPVRYGRTRNFITGDVTYLSPYISRGVISTKFVLDRVLQRGINPNEITKFIQELAWRDYWQQLWIAHGEGINKDLKHEQTNVTNHGIPSALVNATTGINAIDTAIQKLYVSGYLHNHVRMYTAAIACNMGGSHWHYPAQWMYYHLLDADWASNALSWQWVAGANSNKKYVANQENINKYCNTSQQQTFVDVPYAAFSNWEIPTELEATQKQEFTTLLPETANPKLDQSKPTLVYNFYNLDPYWHNNLDANRLLLLEPSVFKRYPISSKTLDWTLELAKNIPNIQVFTAEFTALKALVGTGAIHYKEHPLNQEYTGIEESRDWMFSVTGAYRSFFAFWKKAQKELKG